MSKPFLSSRGKLASLHRFHPYTYAMAVHFETRDDFLKAPLCIHTLAIQLDNLTLEIAVRSYVK